MKNERSLTQDNEPNPWSSIGLQAAMIVNKLRVQAQLSNSENKERAVISGDEECADTEDEKREAEARRDLEWRIRDMTRMENALRRQTRK